MREKLLDPCYHSTRRRPFCEVVESSMALKNYRISLIQGAGSRLDITGWGLSIRFDSQGILVDI
jgi:hypothetical protein